MEDYEVGSIVKGEVTGIESYGIFVKIDEYRQEHKEDFIFCKAVTCPVKKIKTKFRYQILMRIEKDKEDEILENVYKIIDETNARKTQIFVELNPQNLG